jgi:hypothetical protein
MFKLNILFIMTIANIIEKCVKYTEYDISPKYKSCFNDKIPERNRSRKDSIKIAGKRTNTNTKYLYTSYTPLLSYLYNIKIKIDDSITNNADAIINSFSRFMFFLRLNILPIKTPVKKHISPRPVLTLKRGLSQPDTYIITPKYIKNRQMYKRFLLLPA